MRQRDEPCTIDAEEVAEFLEEQRSPRRAEFVRNLGCSDQRANLREADLRSEINRLVEALWKYEGRPVHAIRDPKSDD